MRQLKMKTKKRASVHIFIFDQKGRLLICKRPSTKETYPDLWTSSAGGRVEAGEDNSVAAYRELSEELGVSVPLIKVASFAVRSSVEKTPHTLYVGTIADDMPIQFDSGEVSTHRWVGLKILLREVEKKEKLFAKPFLESLRAFVHYKTHARKILVLDFDHTVFDWYAFKKRLFQSLKKQYAISKNDFEHAKTEIESGGDGLYNVHAHLRALSARTKKPYRTLLSVLNKQLNQVGPFLFKDARKFIRKMYTKKYSIHILSYGDYRNQMFFIKKVLISMPIDRIKIVGRKNLKNTYVLALSHQPRVSEIVLVNDDPEETRTMLKKQNALVRGYVVERPCGKYKVIPQDSTYTVVRDLGECVPIGEM